MVDQGPTEVRGKLMKLDGDVSTRQKPSAGPAASDSAATKAKSVSSKTSAATSSPTTSSSSHMERSSSKSSSEDEDMSPQRRKELLRQKKNAAVRVLVTLFPRIPKVTTVLLEFFIKRENKVSFDRDPLSHFCQEQCVLAAQDSLQKLVRQYITYQDLRDMVENLVGLHALCLRRAPEKAKDLGLTVRKLTIIVGELATSLEKISEVPVTDWMAVGDAVIAKTSTTVVPDDIRYTEFVPRVSDLEAIKLLGAGGFGAVYKARYKPANLACVVKIVSSDRFKRPQQACIDKVVASVIRSPFLVKYYACFATKVQIVMAQLTLAVEHLHLKGFIHRDIKISNMLVIPGGRVKLIDFDTNKVCLGHFTKRVMKGYFRRTPFEFRDCESAGTVPYMAPEVIKRRPYGRACDWWSTGIVFYKLMTGRVPFRGKTKTLLCDRIISAPLRWPRTIEHPHSATSIAKDMVYLLLKKNPIERLGSKQYRDIKGHAFFDDFNWQKLRETGVLFHIPGIRELMDEDSTHSDHSQGYSSPGGSEETKKRKLLHTEDLVDLDSSQHYPLFTYASPTFKRIVGMVKDGEPITLNETAADVSDTSSSELDYQKMTGADSAYGFSGFSGSGITNGRSRRATEKLDLILFRKRSFGRFWSFGVNLEVATGEAGKNFYIVESVKRGSPAQRSQILEGDVVVAVNGTKVGELALDVVRKIMDSSGDQLVLTVLSSSPFRIINTRQDMVSILQTCGRETMTVELIRSGCRNAAWYGFTTIEAKTWDQHQKDFIRLHIIKKVTDVHILTRDRGLFPGDILTSVDNAPVDHLSHAVLRQAMSKALPELQITIAPLSPLRMKRPSFTRLHETFLSDENVREPSSAAAIDD